MLKKIPPHPLNLRLQSDRPNTHPQTISGIIYQIFFLLLCYERSHSCDVVNPEPLMRNDWFIFPVQRFLFSFSATTKIFFLEREWIGKSFVSVENLNAMALQAYKGAWVFEVMSSGKTVCQVWQARHYLPCCRALFPWKFLLLICSFTQNTFGATQCQLIIYSKLTWKSRDISML